MIIKSINPADGSLIKKYRSMTAKEVSAIIAGVSFVYGEWRKTSFAERSEKLRNASGILRSRKEEFARLMTLEMGKPIAQSRTEVEKCAWGCDFFAENAEKFLTPEIIPTDAAKSYVAFTPLGVVLAIMPWNFPFWQVFRFAAPAIMAGNAVVLKHASNVSGCALAVEGIFRDAGFPKDLFRTLLVAGKDMGKVIDHPAIQAVTLTGSTPAGRSVAARAGAALKKVVLELGGSDPYVVLADADLDQTLETCVFAKLLNTGQSCVAAKRFIVVEPIRKEFERRLVEKMREKKMGDPFDEKADLGPLARVDLRDELHQQVLKSLKKGAKLLLGGKIPEGEGAFYPPTVLTGVKKGQPAYDEELFGPVASIISVKDEQEAIRVANDTPFGLGAAVFTNDIVKGEHIAASEFEAGNCFVNTHVKSDPRLPFGGIKQSGYGRELSSFGIREFVNIKTVFIK